MELQELVVILGKMVGARIVQRRGNRARERWRCGLDVFVVRQFNWRFSTHKRMIIITEDDCLFKRGLWEPGLSWKQFAAVDKTANWLVGRASPRAEGRARHSVRAGVSV